MIEEHTENELEIKKRELDALQEMHKAIFELERSIKQLPQKQSESETKI